MSKQGRKRNQEWREQQAKLKAKAKRRARIVQSIAGVVVLALAGSLGFMVYQSVTDGKPGGGSPTATATPSGMPSNPQKPDTVEDNGAVFLGSKTAPATMTLYYDYMCPACQQFEKVNAGDIAKLMNDGKVRVELRPLTFLDRLSQGTEYSTRAANAFYTVASEAPYAIWPFHNALYENQPKENTAGLTDEQIAEIAKQAGLPDAIIAKFKDNAYRDLAQKSSAANLQSTVKQTPTVFINGTEFTGDLFKQGPLKDALLAAIEAAGGTQ